MIGVIVAVIPGLGGSVVDWIASADREASGEDIEAPHMLWSTQVWFAGLLVLASLFGFVIALAIFLVAFLRVRAGLGWLRTLMFSALGIAFMW